MILTTFVGGMVHNNELSIYFVEDIFCKTKSILFKRRNKSNLSLNITRNENAIKQRSVVKYLGCY